MDRYGNQPFQFRGGGGFVERAGGGGPSDLAWVIFGLLLALVLLAIISLALDAYYRSQGSPGPFFKWLPPGGPALAVLDMRYARGELGRKDYLRAREDLGTPLDLDDEATTEVQVPPPGRGSRKT